MFFEDLPEVREPAWRLRGVRVDVQPDVVIDVIDVYLRHAVQIPLVLPNLNIRAFREVPIQGTRPGRLKVLQER